MKFLLRSLAASLIAMSALAQAQTPSPATSFPTRPITIVVPYPAGGTSDNQVRMISEPLSKILGQTIIVDNKPGASGALAAATVARAAPDGYTLLYPNNGVLIASLINKQAGYEPLKDFAPISTVTKVPMVLVINKTVPADNLRDFVKYAKANPGKLNYATAGPASFGNLATSLLSQVAGIKMNQIPYRGEAATTLAVRSGESHVLLTSPSSAMLGQVKEGNLKLLGVATEKSTDIVPGAQPIAEVLPGFSAQIWFGLLAPAGTPQPVVQKLNAAIQQVLQDTGIRARMFASGALAEGSTSAALEKLMRTEYSQFKEVILKNDIKGD